MRRGVLLPVLLMFVAANIAGGFAYWRHLRNQLVPFVMKNPQEKLADRRMELEEINRVANDYERRAGVTLADAIQLFDTAAVSWTEIALESSGEAGAPRLDVIAVRGLVGSVEQLSNVDKRLGSRCRRYQRSPTREGPFLLSCQVKPGAFKGKD